MGLTIILVLLFLVVSLWRREGRISGGHSVGSPDFTGWIGDVRIRGGIVVLAGGLMVGCATTQHAGEPGLPDARGKASYYAGEYAGRSTANGELFDPEALTAAHRSLPFGTQVRVTRLDVSDEPSVVVRINDRGPFKPGRIIDLSRAAARQLEMIREGIVNVQLEIVSYPEGVNASSSSSSGRAW